MVQFYIAFDNGCKWKLNFIFHIMSEKDSILII